MQQVLLKRNVGLAPQVAAGFTVIVGVIFVVTTVIFLQFVDRFDRRTILTVGGTGMALSFFAPAALGALGVSEGIFKLGDLNFTLLLYLVLRLLMGTDHVDHHR
ncbi:MFS transporter [Bacillus sp. SL00103]